MTLSSLTKNKFIQASSIVFIGSMLANVLNYLFSIVMGRLLPPEVFGELVSLITILLIIGIPATTLSLVLANYTAVHKTKGENAEISALIHVADKSALYVGIISFFAMIILSPILSKFFQISLLKFLSFTLLVPITFFTASVSGILQGEEAFKKLSIINVGTALIKFIFSIILVLVGLSIYGVFFALILAGIIMYFYGKKHVRSYVSATNISIKWRDVISEKREYVWFLFKATLFLAIFTNIDLLLSKHFLTSMAGGEYAALATLGKIVTYGSAAVLTVLFPFVVSSHENDKTKSRRFLGIALAVVAAGSALIVGIFYLFPTQILTSVLNTSYAGAAPYLYYFGAAMGFTALASVFVQYFLATSHKAFLKPLIILAIFETVGIMIFHTNILSIVLVSLTSSFLLLLSMTIVYFAYNLKTQNI